MQLENNWQLDSTVTDCNSTAVAVDPSCMVIDPSCMDYQLPVSAWSTKVDQPVATSCQLVFGSQSSNQLRAASLTFGN
jgi:hypothetical protein